MKITVNGQEKEVGAATIAGLLQELEVKSPDQVAVELNGGILHKSDYETTAVQEGDAVEFVYFMGGGQNAD
ncbi:MAG TPA: sulfur carrier protein ThiS [Candidatus Hydrogenedentes bacterium]|nr:sulfur carrier protein ThiS [Candidatus Hydrogenedentota bacterium]